MPYPEWAAGQTITAALLNAGKMEYVTNLASQTNATTTMTDATNLGFAVTANSRWWVMCQVAYDAPTATDAKFAWTAPTGTTMGRNIISQAVGTTTNIDTNVITIRRGTGTAQAVGGPNSVTSAFSTHQEIVDVQIGANAGTVQFQFAANAAGTATLQADSMIWYMQVA